MLRVSNSPSSVCRQSCTIVIPDELRQVYAPADGLAMKDQEKRKVQVVPLRLSLTEGDRKQDMIGGSFATRSSQPSYRTCIHFEVPLRSKSSVVFLDKSLLISLMDLDGRGAGKPTLYRSTLSVRLGVSSCRRFPNDYKAAKMHEVHRVAMLDQKQHICGSRSGHCNIEGSVVERIAPSCNVSSKAIDAETHFHSNTLGLLAFRRPSPLNTKTGIQKKNADETAFLTHDEFRQKKPASSTGTGMNSPSYPT